MALAGLEPATSWVRFRRSPGVILAWLSAFWTTGALPNTLPTLANAVLNGLTQVTAFRLANVALSTISARADIARGGGLAPPGPI